ncbi:hypothetical protein [Paenirhodobacter sp.]|uniref:hypothetical protein n=1 Tax=Paenirhodobacter sp. TaxID=1965326 RepID=UPI003B3DB9BF
MNILILVAFLSVTFASSVAGGANAQGMECRALHEASGISRYGLKRTVCADVVALDQTLVYNRFGSFNPFGMMFALRRDVVPADQQPEKFTAELCDDDTGTAWNSQELAKGNVRLRDCKRPRPLVLRANVGDLLTIRLENLLFVERQGDATRGPDFSSDFCANRMEPRFGGVGGAVSAGPGDLVSHGEASCADPASPDYAEDPATPPDWPATRGVNFAI